jgi:anti-sigma regulatory factor (Ser/Thr protein kinase)
MLIDVSESSQTGEARRRAAALAEDLKMNEAHCGAVALATTEMATNIVKHAGKGYIVIQRLNENGVSGLRLLSVDRGPGIPDVPRALSDGHSTAGSGGSGLGAIRRASDRFDIYSVPGSGTVICAEFLTGEAATSSHPLFSSATVSEPVRGETVCGDGWAVRDLADGSVFMVVDGLGHGTLASETAREAERIVARARFGSLLEVVQDTHDALKKTRGAAFGIARIEPERKVLTYAGVGNVSATIVSRGATRALVSHNGTLGHEMRHLQEFVYPWGEDSVLVMHSDGLGSRWEFDRYPGITAKPPSVIAAILHRDYNRGRDDVTVLVAKAAA